MLLMNELTTSSVSHCNNKIHLKVQYVRSGSTQTGQHVNGMTAYCSKM